MKRLTKRINENTVVYTLGKYSDTIPAEMDISDIRAVLRRLAEYEDAEEQGKIIELPCKIGDLVYELVEYKGGGGHALPLKVVGLHLRDEQSYRGMPRKEYIVVRSIYCGFGFSKHIDLDKIGKTVFLTKESAEQALKESETK